MFHYAFVKNIFNQLSKHVFTSIQPRTQSLPLHIKSFDFGIRNPKEISKRIRPNPSLRIEFLWWISDLVSFSNRIGAF